MIIQFPVIVSGKPTKELLEELAQKMLKNQSGVFGEDCAILLEEQVSFTASVLSEQYDVEAEVTSTRTAREELHRLCYFDSITVEMQRAEKAE